MKRMIISLICVGMGVCGVAQTPAHRFVVPDVDGYQTVVVDNHIHTVFSWCGAVWPTNRVDEAYMEGLDAICITDHLELYRPLMGEDRNVPWQIANDYGKSHPELKVIRGCEITRGMPPGHVNALFTTDNNPISDASLAHGERLHGDEVAALFDAARVARGQGAFLIWNHPDWAGNVWDLQAPNKTAMLKCHKDLLKEGLMDGIEIYNGCFCPEAFEWCLKHNLTIVSGTDVHSPIYMDVEFSQGDYRPVTLAFVKENTEEGIKEAYLSRRTCVTAEKKVWGRESELRPLAEAIIEISGIYYHEMPESVYHSEICVKLKNTSSIPVWISKGEDNEDYVYSRHFYLAPGEERGLNIGIAPAGVKAVDLNLVIDNFFVSPTESLKLPVHIEAE